MQLQFQYKDDLITLHVEPDGDAWRVRLPDGSEHRIRVLSTPDDVLQIAEIQPDPSGMRVFRVPFARLENGTGLAYRGMTYTFRPPSPRSPSGKSQRASGALTAPMAGVVADILVTAGQTVAAYQPLVVLEAMKVMTTLDAPFAGTVKTLHVQLKQQIGHGAPVVEVVPSEKQEEQTEKQTEEAAERPTP